MKTEIRYFWRVQNQVGRWYTTRFEASEEFIRRSHPEAVAIPESRVERQVLDTEEEILAAMTRSHGGGPAPGYK